MKEEGLMRDKGVVRSSIVGVITNLLLTIFKALVGFLSNSSAILSDAVNSLSDVLSSAITIIGTKLSARPADREHPFGHGRIEYIASILVAVVIFYAGVDAFWDGLQAIIQHTKTHYDTAAILVVSASVVAKLLLGQYLRKKGRTFHSEALFGSGTDSMFDSIASASILVSAALSLFLHIDIDGWLAMGISVLVLKAGIDVLKASSDSIIGTRISDSYARELKTVVSSFPGVLGAYDLILDTYGPNLAIGSIHIGVEDDMTARQFDGLSRQIEHKMYHDYGIIMTVGVYAANTSDPMSAGMLERVHELAARQKEILQVHGFYVDRKEKSVSFDIILDFSVKNGNEYRQFMIDALREDYPGYKFHITIDRDFSA